MNIGVYGLGRFGYFWAAILSKNFKVAAFSRNPERPVPPGVERVSEEEVCGCGTLFLCTAISSLNEVLPRISPLLKPGTLVADTCSVKVRPVKMMEAFLPSSAQILATHPMFGPDSAKTGLKGLPLVYHPVRMGPENDAYWKSYFNSLGLSVIEMTPDEHDRQAAYTQGVTHFIGRVLDDMKLEPNPIGTMGYGSLLSIIQQTCNDPWQLFLDLQLYNPHTEEMRRKLKSSLEEIMGIISKNVSGV
ncbi:MAG: prephenate dehydrogenase/arogenate dehydrogenase family protein [Spirochaetales bacterium]|nr:MAG: prephenate dehydrogenase/arogenate dehydrogenase family protein [Spirochaetales bacterium]